MMLCKKQKIILIVILILLMSCTVSSLTIDSSGSASETETSTSDTSPSYPSSYTATDWPQDDGSVGSPPNPYRAENGAMMKDYEGLHINGNKITFDSVSYIARGTDFAFNDVKDGTIILDNDKLVSASVTSSKNNNKVVINNPFEIGSKINIYLNKTQTMFYENRNDYVKIKLPENAYINITKGATRNIVVEGNGDFELIINNTPLSNMPLSA